MGGRCIAFKIATRIKAIPSHRKVSELIKKISIKITRIAKETMYHGSKLETRIDRFTKLSFMVYIKAQIGPV